MVNIKHVTSGGFSFTTHADTRKVRDLDANPRCSIVFWWPALNRQVRAACVVEPLERVQVEELFRGRPVEHQVASVVSPQGAVIPNLDAIRQSARELLEREPRAIDCPDHFAGYVAVPYVIEFWSQGPHRLHERVEYRRTGRQWHRRLLAP